MEVGTRVRIIEGRIDLKRPHLRQHAKNGDIGEVTTAHHPGVPTGYIVVRFAQCVRGHRLLPEELEILA